MIPFIFHFTYSKQSEISFQRIFINFVGDMQCLHCKKFFLNTIIEGANYINAATKNV